MKIQKQELIYWRPQKPHLFYKQNIIEKVVQDQSVTEYKEYVNT